MLSIKNQKNRPMGILQYPNNATQRTYRRRKIKVRHKQPRLTAASRRLHNARRVERESRAPFNDKRTFRRSFLQS